MRHLLLIAGLAVSLLSGCSLISTTTDTTAAVAGAITDATAASADATTGITDGDAVDYARATQYVESQLVYLRRDAASGQGENIAAFASLMGETNEQAFGQWMQNNYTQLFSVQRSSEELVHYIATQRS